MAMSSVGTANKVIGVESASPPITARASGRCSSLPAPMPRARGSKPNRVQSVVIRIGRRRTRAASRIATSSDTCSVCIRSRVKSSRMIPFLTISPTSRIRPMNDETLSAVCVTRRSPIAPTNERGAARSTTRGSTKEENCTTSTATRREHGDGPEAERVEAHRIGRADADPDAPVVAVDLARVHAEQRTAHGLAHPRGRQPDLVRLRGVDMHRHLGRRLAHAAEEILEALDARYGGVELGPVRLEGRQVWAEQLDFHWPGAAPEVVDDVRKNLDELDPHARERGRRPRPDLVDDLVDRPVALALGLEPDRVVAAVLQRREQAQLGAGPPTGPGHLRDPGADALDG